MRACTQISAQEISIKFNITITAFHHGLHILEMFQQGLKVQTKLGGAIFGWVLLDSSCAAVEGLAWFFSDVPSVVTSTLFVLFFNTSTFFSSCLLSQLFLLNCKGSCASLIVQGTPLMGT